MTVRYENWIDIDRSQIKRDFDASLARHSAATMVVNPAADRASRSREVQPMTEPTKQDWADLREYCRRVDRMLKAYETKRDIDSTPTWVLAAILLTMGAIIFFAGMLAGAKLF
jgi:hypothetical protein